MRMGTDMNQKKRLNEHSMKRSRGHRRGQSAWTLLILLAALLLCAKFGPSDEATGQQYAQEVYATENNADQAAGSANQVEEDRADEEDQKDEAEPSTTASEDVSDRADGGDTAASAEEYSQSTVSASPESIPDYDGENAVIELNGNVPNFNEYDAENITGDHYSDLDALGRCGVAYAMLDQSMMPTEARGDIHMIHPTGWHSVDYPDLIEDSKLYNRSHLLAFSLTGQNANEKNLITGTQYLNQELMVPYENKVVRYVENTGKHALYRVTPYFKDDELVARGVEMEALSVEDGGETLQYHIFIYNVQPGIEIDYATGDSWVAE